jgi:Predicted membrane protein
MENQNIIITKRKSEIRASREELVYLSYNNEMLIPCNILMSDDDIAFNFDAENLVPGTGILGFQEEKYRFLANCAKFELLSREFDFSMNLENLMYDINLCPKVMIRDKVENNPGNSFIKKYKALAGAVLAPKYTYEDYYKGGEDLYKKNSDIAKMSEFNSAWEISRYFIEKYEQIRSEKRAKTVAVGKTSLKIIRIAIPVLAAGILVMAFFVLTAYIKTIPLKDTLLTANENYLTGNYVEVQKGLFSIPMEDLSKSEKYILSRSYVASEGMTQKQKANVLNTITTNADIAVLDYWISVGRLDFDNAVDRAQKIGDDQLLIYAYIKHRAVVKEDNTISGEEKTTLLSSLEEKINRITESLEE